MAEYDIGACIFFINEEKFLSYSIRSFLGCEHVKTIVLIEGCVKNFSSENVKIGRAHV